MGFDDDPNVSPDGKLVTFVRVKTPEVEQALFSMHLDGSHLRQLTPYDLEVGIKHDWAPDGSRIAIISHADAPEPGQSANVATIRPDGSGLQMLTNFRGGEVNAVTGSYSPMVAGSFTVSPTMAASRSTSCPLAAASRVTSCRCPWRRAISTGGHDRRT